MSLSTSPRSHRFRQQSSSLRIGSTTEEHEPENEHVPGSKLTTSLVLDVQSDSGPRLNLSPSLHRTLKPLPSILKRKAQTTGEQENINKNYANRFEISVVQYRTSCCESVVSLEYISDWIHETLSDVYRCPSCMLPCIMNALCATPTPAQSQSLLSITVSLGRSSERVLSFAHTFFQQKCAAILSSPRSTYPETEFSSVLSSSLFMTDVRETSVRLLSITGLTLVLLALLSP